MTENSDSSAVKRQGYVGTGNITDIKLNTWLDFIDCRWLLVQGRWGRISTGKLYGDVLD